MIPKLVRDKIPEIIEKADKIPKTHIANNDEYWELLRKKLIEEVTEFLEDNSKEELADTLEVIYAICDYKKISREEIEGIRLKKQKERGAFKDKIILDGVE
jgi:predicted house-cleaning noncanonical NTP pyrophosphatase (MazG superfamily)